MDSYFLTKRTRELFTERYWSYDKKILVLRQTMGHDFLKNSTSFGNKTALIIGKHTPSFNEASLMDNRIGDTHGDIGEKTAKGADR